MSATKPTFELRRILFIDGTNVARTDVLASVPDEGESEIGISVEATIENARGLTIAEIEGHAFAVAKRAMAAALEP